MALSIFPTINDVGGNGAGKVATEANLTKFLKRIMWRNSVISGGTYVNAAGLTANIAAVEAVIEGYIAGETAQLQAVCQANATNHVYWQLTRDAQQYVSGAQIVVNQTGAEPADAVKLMVLTTNGTTITANVDARPLNYYDSLLGHKHNPIVANDGGAIPFSSLMFGDGSDGDYNSTGNVTLAVGADDAGPVVKQYKSFTLNAGHTMTVDRRSKGLVLFIQGNCTINGTIDMNNLAARVARSASEPLGASSVVVSWPHAFSRQLVTMLLPAGGAGGAGGNGGTSYSGGSGGAGGGAGSNCAFGGSGGGGGGSGITRNTNNYPSGAGGGGAGNGGAGGNGATANSSSNPGGSGGVGGGTGGAGGAAGVYGGWSQPPGSPGGSGGGGIIIIVCRGNVTIGVGGIVRANSSGAGGAGSTANNPSGQSGDGGGGGGAGGGIVFIAYGGTYANSGAIQVNASSGGATGTGSYPGTAGGSGQAGSIYAVKAGV